MSIISNCIICYIFLFFFITFIRMDKCNIVDNRKTFTRLSFSNHKKNKVIEELISCLYYKKETKLYIGPLR